MGWDTQINGDGDTVADGVLARLDGIEDKLGELVDVLKVIAEALKPTITVNTKVSARDVELPPADPMLIGRSY